MWSRTTLTPLALLVALAAPAAEARAQWGDAHLVVTAVSEETQQPLSGAEVLLDGRGRGRTDAAGVYRVTGIDAGSRVVIVRHLGFAPERVVVQAASGRATRVFVALTTRPIPLAEIRVHARSGAGLRMLHNRGFFDRQRNSGGFFFNRSDIERSHSLTTADLLARVPGVQIARSFGSSRASMNRNATRSSCPVQYFVDGIPVYAFGLEEMRLEDLEGVEVYRGASQIPPEFNRHNAMCGVVVFWTRVD